jgi:hypothetical protein
MQAQIMIIMDDEGFVHTQIQPEMDYTRAHEILGAAQRGLLVQMGERLAAAVKGEPAKPRIEIARMGVH